ncbi:hypothetical protein ATANTOWER_030215 [Ataeniobius toweri]|uniref:Uncharacterized protein n=1 Tax=Ataeniobius toweri TaxID=208326 RepID=A0ABU7B101_9TELE|nr:hypothetical protein [Ataeniobius toweri]
MKKHQKERRNCHSLAGLGKHSVTISENMTHSEISDLLVNAYPRLANICGGWMLHKSTGGGGRRNLVVIPPDLHGYTGQQLKVVSGNGKYTLYLSPLQEEQIHYHYHSKQRSLRKCPKPSVQLARKWYHFRFFQCTSRDAGQNL